MLPVWATRSLLAGLLCVKAREGIRVGLNTPNARGKTDSNACIIFTHQHTDKNEFYNRPVDWVYLPHHEPREWKDVCRVDYADDTTAIPQTPLERQIG